MGISGVRQCIACGSDNWKVEETWRAYRLATCRTCGVTFTVNPDYAQERYVAAYEEAAGELPVPAERAYVYAAPKQRLAWEAMAFPILVPAPRLTPPEKLALKWLKSHAPRRALIIDCGCGTGRFLRGLLRSGFRGVGVELSRPLVELLTRRRFEAVLGAAPDFPWEGPVPFAITFFEVLEHLADPARILRPLRERFPRSAVLASTPSPLRASLLLKKQRDLCDFPPNHYVRWTPVGLRQLFEGMSYSRVSVTLPAPVGSEMVGGLGQLMVRNRRFLTGRTNNRNRRPPTMGSNVAPAKRAEATAALWALKTYQVLADVVGLPLAVRARCKGASSGSMLVIATP